MVVAGEVSPVSVKQGLQPGQVVCSTAGRDKGRLYVVVGILDSRYVTVADGELRKVENPKKKNIRHLQVYSDVIPGFTMMQISNTEIRRALESYRRPDGKF